MYSLLLTLFVCIISTRAISPQPLPSNTSIWHFAINSTEAVDEVADYYWRDYYGTIPSDALPGGIDRSGKATYIGQVYVLSQGLLPAIIYHGTKTALTTVGGKSYTADEFIKILCSRNIEKFQWIITKPEETQLLTNCHLVVGGHQDGYLANIGRVNLETETVVGKVFSNYMPNKGITVPTRKATEARYQQYEILAYNCNPNKLNGNSTLF